MTTIKLKLERASAKFLKNYPKNNGDVGLHPIFKSMITIAAEIQHLYEPTSVIEHEEGYDAMLNAIYHESLTEEVEVPISKERRHVGTAYDFGDARIWIPPHKMYLVNTTIRKLLDDEINHTVEIYLNNNMKVNDAIYYVMDKYDIDEEDYKMDSAYKMNQRHRKNFS